MCIEVDVEQEFSQSLGTIENILKLETVYFSC